MLQKTVQFIGRLASLPALVVMLLLTLLFPLLIFPMHGLGETRLPDLYFSYRPDQLGEQLTALGAQGRRAYLRMATTSDLVFPVSYALTFSMACLLALRGLNLSAGRPGYLCLFPFLIVVADWCENLLLSYLTSVYPARFDTVAALASVCTSLKWTLVLSTVVLLLVLWILRAARLFRGRAV